MRHSDQELGEKVPLSGLEAAVDSVSPGELIKTDCCLASGSVALALPC